jgi:hypothetical protein
MRCLHCNKKLSLLKLAKGDDFCSPEHFDAYQFQLSKTAIQRLMAAPAEVGPKPPLILTIKEETSPDDKWEAQAPLRDPDLREASIQKEPDSIAPLSTDPPPPYAPFAIALLPPSTMKAPTPVSNVLDLDEPAASTREVSFPVHEWEATTCLLNLYARVSFSEATPLNWTSPRNLTLSAESFPRDVIRPSSPTLQAVDAVPDVQELENLVPGEPAPALEIAPPVAAAPSVQAAPPISPLAPVDAAPSKPVELARSVKPITRLPFLIAPSFLERTGPSDTLNPARSIPHASTLGPVLDLGRQRSEFSNAIAPSTLFAAAASHQVQNSCAAEIESASELRVATTLVLSPPEHKIHQDRWHASSHVIALTSKALEIGREATVPLDFVPAAAASTLVRPKGAFARRGDQPQRLETQQPVGRAILPHSGNVILTSELPSPEPPGHSDPIALASQAPEMRSIQTASLFRAPEACPLGQEPVFADPSVSAIGFGWRANLAKSPVAEPLSTTAWHNQAPHFPLPASIADHPERRTVPIQLLPYEPACVLQKPGRVQSLSVPQWTSRPAEWRGFNAVTACGTVPAEVRFSVVPDVSTRVLPVAVERPLGVISSTIFFQLDLRYVTVTAGSTKPSIGWESGFSTSQEPPSVRFLPLREDPVLPSAKEWTRFTSLHR